MKAVEAVRLANVGIHADAASVTGAGGLVHIQAPTVAIQNTMITANGGSLGVAGQINIFAMNLAGTSYGALSILNSTLSTLGYAAGLNSGIYLKGSTVDLSGTTLQLAPTLSAQIWTKTGTLAGTPASGSYQLHTLP